MAFLNETGLERLWQHIVTKLGTKADASHTHGIIMFDDGAGNVTLTIENQIIITFTIEGNSYQAEDGMTWAEWVESDYNTAGLSKDSTIICNGNGEVLDGVISSDLIVDGGQYVFADNIEII